MSKERRMSYSSWYNMSNIVNEYALIDAEIDAISRATRKITELTTRKFIFHQ